MFMGLRTMMAGEMTIRFRCGIGRNSSTKEVVVLRYVTAFWVLIMTCFSCEFF